MRDAQDGQQAVSNDIINTLVANNTAKGIVIGQFVVDFAFRRFLIGFQERTGCTGKTADM